MNHLLYDGAGAYLYGVPGRPLSLDDLAAGGYDVAVLLASGLYRFATTGEAPFPVDPAAPTAPANVTQTNAYNPRTGQVDAVYTWDAAQPGPDRAVAGYRVYVMTPAPGRVYRQDAAAPQLQDRLFAGASVVVCVAAVDDQGAVGALSAPLAFTAAPVPADVPSDSPRKTGPLDESQVPAPEAP